MKDGDIIKIYVLWGGQYDVREMEVIDYDGAYHLEDTTGGHISFTTERYMDVGDAKVALANHVFSIGEPTSYIDFGEDGVWRDCDPRAWFLTMSHPDYIRFAAYMYVDK